MNQIKILYRYVAKSIAITTGLALAVVLGMDFFIKLINEFNDIGTGNYHLLEAFIFVTLTMPSELYNLFPMAGLLGCLMGLGLLATHSELVVMRSAGLSIKQITAAVLVTILFMVVLLSIFGETFTPYATRFAEQNKAMAKSAGQAVSTQHGVWIREKSDFLHIGTIYPDGKIENITRYFFNDTHQLTSVAKADTAEYHKGHWRLNNVDVSNIAMNGVTSQHYNTQEWKVHLRPSVLRIARIEPDEMTLEKLFEVIDYRKHNGQHYSSYALVFWQRIFHPLTACVMMLLAIPFIFGPLRSATMGLRLVVGVIVGFSFYIMNQLIGSFSLVYQIPPVIAAILPAMLFTSFGWYLLLGKSR